MTPTGLAAHLTGLTPEAPASPAPRARVRLLEAPPRAAVKSRTHMVAGAAGETVSSRQWLRLPVTCPAGEECAPLLRSLDRAYLDWIERVTSGLVGVTLLPDGGARVAVVPIGPTGLRLAAPAVTLGARGGSILRPILSGVLVARGGGAIGVALAPSALDPGETIVSVELAGFFPRLRNFGWPGRFLYQRAQTLVHVRLSRSFLRHTAAPLVLEAAGLLPREAGEAGRGRREAASSVNS